MTWRRIFKQRMDAFQASHDIHHGWPISVKIRVTGGCFHRQHSPAAYRIVDNYISSSGRDEIRFEEHESGPEVLLILAATTAGITLAKSVIDLITTIIKARSEGQKEGDVPSEPLELIVRGHSEDGEFFEEIVMRVGARERPTESEIQKALQRGLEPHLPKGQKHYPKKSRRNESRRRK